MKQYFCKTKFLWGILLGLCYYFGQSYVILAHAELASSNPAPGQVLTDFPDEIRLEFNESIGLSSTFTVFDSDFNTIPILVEINASTDNIMTGRNVEISEPGVYTVQWLVISQDGHRIDGSYSFAIDPENRNGGTHDMELMAAAESTAVNLPGWFAWIMVALAIGVPFLVRNMTRN